MAESRDDMRDELPDAAPELRRAKRDAVWARNEPDSPCVSLCVVHPVARICAGCGRTPDEIAAWPTLDALGRSAIRAELPARLEGLKDPALRPSRRRSGRR